MHFCEIVLKYQCVRRTKQYNAFLKTNGNSKLFYKVFGCSGKCFPKAKCLA